MELCDSQLNPSDKLRQIMDAYNGMKISVVEYYKATEDVITMDDELPLVIFIVGIQYISNTVIANCKNRRLLKDMKLIYEYYQSLVNCENEVRIVTNFKVAVQYIREEWQI